MNTIDIRKDESEVEAVRFSDSHFIEIGCFGKISISDNNCEEVIDIPYRDIDNFIIALKKVKELEPFK